MRAGRYARDPAKADMIGLGHRALGRLKTRLADSVTQKVTNTAPCTTVTVR